MKLQTAVKMKKVDPQKKTVVGEADKPNSRFVSELNGFWRLVKRLTLIGGIVTIVYLVWEFMAR